MQQWYVPGGTGTSKFRWLIVSLMEHHVTSVQDDRIPIKFMSNTNRARGVQDEQWSNTVWLLSLG